MKKKYVLAYFCLSELGEVFSNFHFLDILINLPLNKQIYHITGWHFSLSKKPNTLNVQLERSGV